MARSPVQNQQEVMPKALPVPYTHVEADPTAFGATAGAQTQQAAQAAIKGASTLDQAIEWRSFMTDQAAVADAVTKAANQYRERMLSPEGLYSKSPQSIFAGGRTAEQAYREAAQEYEDQSKPYLESLTSPRQKQMFQQAWARGSHTEMNRVANFLADSNRKFIEKSRTDYMLGIDDQLAAEQAAVENNWRGWSGSAQKGVDVVKQGLGLQMDPKDMAQKAADWRTGIASAAIRGWFKEQPDRIAASSALYANALGDPEAQKLWNSLSNEDRQKVSKQLIEDTNRLFSMGNSERERRERLQERGDQQVLKDVMFNDKWTGQQREQGLARLRMSPFVTADQLRVAEQFVRNGGRAYDQDVEKHVLDAELAIRNGTIKTDADLIDQMGRNKWVISDSTVRNRLLGLVQVQSDKAFTQVLDWGEAKLGYDKSAAANAIFPDKAVRALDFRARMLEARRKDPAADPWEAANKIVDQLQKQGNAKAESSIPVLAANYRDAIKSGDPKRIADARIALTTILQEAGKVSALDAAREGFDPLSIIENSSGR